MAGAGRRGLILGLATAAFTLLAAVPAGLWLMERADDQPAKPDPREYPVRGIDVSHHNGPIAWRRVKQANIDFAYLKASEGADHRDRQFVANARAAAKVGLPVGAYHFFTLCRSGEVQAKNFLDATATARLRLAPAIDLEFAGNCAERPGRRDFNRELATFTKIVRKQTGMEPVLYVTPAFHAAYIEAGPFRRRKLWFRDVKGKLQGPPFSRVVYWQYADRGHVNGVEGPVDLNVFLGDEPTFKATLAP